ncbi:MULTISPECIES: hypothetical protein [Burkholderia]|uniref:hypothetical protein n=1 Tax=Burkholderia TaxID=32008 RepID=UPI00157A5594|nr:MULTISPECIES: hypothetical protein [Burkholderia]MCU9952225.1 hypothetical protein [Burkholderia sp. BKH01]
MERAGSLHRLVNTMFGLADTNRGGTVTLLSIARAKTYNISIPDLRSKAIEQQIAAHGFPSFEGMRSGLPFFLCVDVVTAVHEKVCRLVVDRCKSLQVAR